VLGESESRIVVIDQSTYVMASLFIDPAVQAEALEIWNEIRTGPYAEYTPFGQIAWTRVAENITESLGDPSSGPNSAHLEFIVGAVSIFMKSGTNNS